MAKGVTTRQKIDRSAYEHIESMKRSLPSNWQELGRTPIGFHYEVSDDYYDEINFEYAAKKQLLGGVYSLDFTATKEVAYYGESINAEMKYKGIVTKGEAYFTQKQGSNSLLDQINQDTELLKALNTLDVLSLKIDCHDQKLTISLSPVGGAYTYTVFPPLKYGGLLPPQDFKTVFFIVGRLASYFKREEQKQIVGANG